MSQSLSGRVSFPATNSPSKKNVTKRIPGNKMPQECKMQDEDHKVKDEDVKKVKIIDQGDEDEENEMMNSKKVRCIELNEFISCILCSGYLIDATTIIECLHSFCRTCLIKHLKNDNSCPRCKSTVHKTKPFSYIRPDPTLQDIVYKIVPGLFKQEMNRRRNLYLTNPEAAKNLTSSEELGKYSGERTIYSADDFIPVSLQYMPVVINYSYLPLETAAPLLQKVVPDDSKLASECPKMDSNDLLESKIDPTSSNLASSDPKLIPIASSSLSNGSKIASMVSRDKPASLAQNFEELNQKRYFRCPAGVTVHHLKKLILNKFDLEAKKGQFTVDIFYRHDQLLDEYSMLDLAYIYSWKRNGSLELFYKITDHFEAKKEEDTSCPKILEVSKSTCSKSISSSGSSQATFSPRTIATSPLMIDVSLDTETESEASPRPQLVPVVSKVVDLKVPIVSMPPTSTASSQLKPNNQVVHPANYFLPQVKVRSSSPLSQATSKRRSSKSIRDLLAKSNSPNLNISNSGPNLNISNPGSNSNFSNSGSNFPSSNFGPTAMKVPRIDSPTPVFHRIPNSTAVTSIIQIQPPTSLAAIGSPILVRPNSTPPMRSVVPLTNHLSRDPYSPTLNIPSELTIRKVQTPPHASSHLTSNVSNVTSNGSRSKMKLNSVVDMLSKKSNGQNNNSSYRPTLLPKIPTSSMVLNMTSSVNVSNPFPAGISTSAPICAVRPVNYPSSHKIPLAVPTFVRPQVHSINNSSNSNNSNSNNLNSNNSNSSSSKNGSNCSTNGKCRHPSGEVPTIRAAKSVQELPQNIFNPFSGKIFGSKISNSNVQPVVSCTWNPMYGMNQPSIVTSSNSETSLSSSLTMTKSQNQEQSSKRPNDPQIMEIMAQVGKLSQSDVSANGNIAANQDKQSAQKSLSPTPPPSTKEANLPGMNNNSQIIELPPQVSTEQKNS